MRNLEFPVFGNHSKEEQSITTESIDKKKNDIEEARAVYEGMIRLMSRKIGLDLNPKQYPVMEIDTGIGDPMFEKTTKDGLVIKKIILRKSEQVYDSKIIGEEIAHFLRDLTSPNDDDATSEFFGYLWESILFESLKSEARNILFPDGLKKRRYEMAFLATEDQIKDKLQKLKIRIMAIYEQMKKENNDLKEEQLRQEGMELAEEYDELEGHYLGYKYASKIDLNKIRDLSKLFNLTEAEIKKRFFKENPDYSDL